ncbi:hypothetical protein V5799_027573 [Amblyomma americanum]|uniref:Uncharacterized protein n=1 Tax=Amblyomma americanum TaxID=6943 RepID=A0AAQ4DFB8_AMBAM
MESRGEDELSSAALKEARARRWNETRKRRRAEETEEERAIRLDKRRKSDAVRKARLAVDSETTSRDEYEEGMPSETESLQLMEERSAVLREAKARRWNESKRRRRAEETEEERAIRLEKRRKSDAARKAREDEGTPSETESLKLMEERSAVLREAKARRRNERKRRRRAEETEEERAIRLDKRRKSDSARKARLAADSESASRDEDEGTPSETERRKTEFATRLSEFHAATREFHRRFTNNPLVILCGVRERLWPAQGLALAAGTPQCSGEDGEHDLIFSREGHVGAVMGACAARGYSLATLPVPGVGTQTEMRQEDLDYTFRLTLVLAAWAPCQACDVAYHCASCAACGTSKSRIHLSQEPWYNPSDASKVGITGSCAECRRSSPVRVE